MKSEIEDLIADELRNAKPESAKIIDDEHESDKIARLEVISGPDQGRVFECAGNSSIGRGPVDVSLADMDVSRLHALLEFVEGQQILIRDTGSTNGTYVNGVRIAEITLKSKDEIKMGSTVFKFDIVPILEAKHE